MKFLKHLLETITKTNSVLNKVNFPNLKQNELFAVRGTTSLKEAQKISKGNTGKSSYYYGKKIYELVDAVMYYNPKYIAVIKGNLNDWEWDGTEGIEYFLNPLDYCDTCKIFGVFDINGKKIV